MQIVDVLSGLNSLVGRYPVAYWQQRRHEASHEVIFADALRDIRSHFASARITLERPTDALQDELDAALDQFERNGSMLYGVQHLEQVALKMQVCLDEQIIRDTLGDHPLLEKLSVRTDTCLSQITDLHAVTAFYQNVLRMIRPVALDIIGQNIHSCCDILAQEYDALSDVENIGRKLQETASFLARNRAMRTPDNLRILHKTAKEDLATWSSQVQEHCQSICRTWSDCLLEHTELRERTERPSTLDFKSLQALQQTIASHLDSSDEQSFQDQMQPFLAWYSMLEDVEILEHLDTWEPAFLSCPMFYQRIRVTVSEVHDNEERAFASRWPAGAGWPAPDDAALSEKLWYGWMALRPFWVLCAGAVSLALTWLGAPHMALVCQGLVLWGDAFRAYHKMRAHARELARHRYRQRWHAHQATWTQGAPPTQPMDMPKTWVLEDCEDLKIEEVVKQSAYQVTLGPCPEEPWLSPCLLYSSQGDQVLGLSEIWVRWGTSMLWDWGWVLRDLGFSTGLATVSQVSSLLGIALHLARSLQIFRRKLQQTHESDWSEPVRRNMRLLHGLVFAFSLGGIVLMVWSTISHVRVVGLLLAVAIQALGLGRERVKIVLKAYKSRAANAPQPTRCDLLWHTFGLRPQRPFTLNAASP